MSKTSIFDTKHESIFALLYDLLGMFPVLRNKRSQIMHILEVHVHFVFVGLEGFKDLPEV